MSSHSHKVLPHRHEEIHQHAAFKALAAVHYAVPQAEGVAPADLAGLVAQGEAEAAGRHVGDLRVGVPVARADRAFLEGVFHAHHRVAVRENLARHPRRDRLPLNVLVKNPRFVHIPLSIRQSFWFVVISIFLFLKKNYFFLALFQISAIFITGVCWYHLFYGLMVY